MNPKEFLQTIYLGDRGCKSLLIDGWNERVVIQVNQISRIRSSSGKWEFYTDEDIVDGLIVFDVVDSISLQPAGFIPNDLINSIEVEELCDAAAGDEMEQKVLFKIYIDSVNGEGRHTEVLIQIQASSVHLEDPTRPGLRIID